MRQDQLTWFPSEQARTARVTTCGQQNSRIRRGRSRPGKTAISGHVPTSPIGRYISRCAARKGSSLFYRRTPGVPTQVGLRSSVVGFE